jgi:hypothetical protein
MRAIETGRGDKRTVDRCGGVFVPDQARGLVTPQYTYGAPGARTLTPIFSCPVSTIAPEHWNLLELWRMSRDLRTPVKAGGLVDQPTSVLASFPFFELEDRRTNGSSDSSAIATGVATAFAAIMGGKRRG